MGRPVIVERVKINCTNCNKEVVKPRSKVNNTGNNFCDQACYITYLRTNSTAPLKKCYMCGTTFKSRPICIERNKSGVFCCSKECRKDFLNSKEDVFDPKKAYELLTKGLTMREVCFEIGVPYNQTSCNRIIDATRQYGKFDVGVAKYNDKPQYNPTQMREEMEILGKFSLRREWRLPQIPTFEEKVFDKAAYFFLTKTTPIYNNMRDIYYSKVTVTYTKNKRTLTETHNVVCTGKDLKEAQSYEDTWKNLLHRVESLRKNATVIAIEPINKIGTTNY